LLLVDGGNECPEPIRLLQSAIELAEAFPGGGLKIVLSWRVNDISQMPTAVFRNTEVLFPAANRLHPNLLAANAYLLQPMSLMETEGAWKSFAAHSSRRFRPRFDFQELQLADRPLAMELSNPLLLRLCMELFHDKALKGKSTGFTNLWRQWWERLRQQPQEAAYLQQLARFLATKGRGQCTLDELFDNADISSAVNNLQVDSPHRQLIRKGVVSQYFQDGFLQVGFTMEAAFHYILSLELTGENLAEHLAGSVFWEAPTRYCLWEGVHDPDDGLLFQLIDDASFPNHLTAFALAQYTVLHGPGKALERLLQMPTPQDWEALTLAARQLRESRPKEHRALADAILDQVLTGGLTASPDALAPLLPDAGKLLADGVFAARVQGQPLRTAEGLQALAAYHSTYGRNREALGCLQVAIELSADIGVKLSVHLLMADQYNQLGLYAAGLSEIAKAKELLGRGVVSDAVLEADIGFSESKLYRSNSFYPRALETLRIAREAYGKKLGTFHAKTLLADDQICRTLLSLGQYTEASDLAERCANDAGRSLGTQNTIYSDFVQLQGDLFKEKGKHDEALDRYKEALTIELSCFGDSHPCIAESYSRIGSIWEIKGNYDKALGYFEQTLSINLEYYGKSHPNVAVSYNQIGSIWETKGNYEKALEYFQKNLEINLQYYGESHPNVAESNNRIGDIWETKGDYDKALGYFEKDLEINLQYYGESHPNVAVSYYRIGGIWKTKGDYDKALEYFEKDLKISIQYYGESHPNLAASYNQIGGIWNTKGDFEKAIGYFDKALEINLQYYGESHPKVAVSYNRIGDIWETKGDYDKALGYFEKNLEINLQYYGESHPKVAVSYYRIGGIWQIKGEYDKALGYFEKDLEISLEYYGESHPNVAASYNQIGGVWETKGDYDKALGYFEKDLEITLQYYGESHPNVAVSYNRIGGIWETKGDYDKALGYFEKNLEINLRYYGESHPNVTVTYNIFGLLYMKLNMFHEALESFKTALHIEQSFQLATHPNIGSIKKNIAHAMIELQQFADAEKLLSESIEVLIHSGIPHDPRLGKAYQYRAMLYRYQERWTEAEAAIEAAIAIFLEENGESHINTADALLEKARIMQAAGNRSESAHWLTKCHAIRLERLGPEHPDTMDVSRSILP
jgi:tetratricopeptide (TPR) repeat protein